MPSEHQVQVAARIINEVCRPGYRAALNLADRVLRAVEGKWDSGKFFDGGGPDHDGLTGKPFGDREDRLKGTPFENLSRSKTGSFGVDQLNSLAEKLMIALGDSTTMDTLTGDPGVLVDRIIAERDGLKILNKDLQWERNKALAEFKDHQDAAANELVRLNDELTEAYAEIKRLRSQLPSPPVHGLEILSETIASDDVTALSVLCPRSGCVYGASIQAPTAEVAHRMVEALAVAHEEEMEEDPDGEG